jgi:hypothetical protein
MRIILLLTLFVFITNPYCFPSPPPEDLEGLNSEQVRQIARCMVAFHRETLESVTASLKKDKILSDFFRKKKGKRYKASKEECTLGQLKSFVLKLQEDIEKMTSYKAELFSLRDKFATHAIAEVEFDDALESYGIYEREKVASRIDFFTSDIKKLATVKSHVEALIAVTIPLAITLETAWGYFDSHREAYLPGMAAAAMVEFKPRFFAHLREYYGLE